MICKGIASETNRNIDHPLGRTGTQARGKESQPLSLTLCLCSFPLRRSDRGLSSSKLFEDRTFTLGTYDEMISSSLAFELDTKVASVEVMLMPMRKIVV